MQRMQAKDWNPSARNQPLKEMKHKQCKVVKCSQNARSSQEPALEDTATESQQEASAPKRTLMDNNIRWGMRRDESLSSNEIASMHTEGFCEK